MDEIRGLTSLRGIAAMYVILYHFSNLIDSETAGGILSLAPGGYLAVDLFFVLSGFIMAYTYAGDFRQHGIEAYPGFLSRRVARLMPLNIFVVLALSTFDYLFAGQITGGVMACNLLMLQALNVCSNLNGPSWSVGVEWIAYFLFPVLLTVVLFRRPAACLLMLAIATVALIALASHGSPLSLYSNVLGPGWDIVRCLSEFTFGLGAYRLYISRWPILTHNMLLITLVAVCIAIIVSRSGDLFAAMLFPLIIAALASNTGWPARVVMWSPLYFLGVMSYSLYLIHAPLVDLELYLLHLLHPEKLSQPWSYTLVIVGACSVILPSYITYCAIERPGRILFRHLFASTKRRAVA